MSVQAALVSGILPTLFYWFSGMTFALASTLFGRASTLLTSDHPPMWLLVTALVAGIVVAVGTLLRSSTN